MMIDPAALRVRRAAPFRILGRIGLCALLCGAVGVGVVGHRTLSGLLMPQMDGDGPEVAAVEAAPSPLLDDLRTGSIDPRPPEAQPAWEPPAASALRPSIERTLTLTVPDDVRAPDNTTFTMGDVTYRLVDVPRVPPTRICSEGGSRWGCGSRARIAFRNAIAGKVLTCTTVSQSDAVTDIRCREGDQPFAPAPVLAANGP